MELEPVMERNGIRYILIDDIYYPDLLLSPDEETECINRMVQQMADKLGVNEELKAQYPMGWVGLMNNLKYSTWEIWNET